jgi:hypothetical protein
MNASASPLRSIGPVLRKILHPDHDPLSLNSGVRLAGLFGMVDEQGEERRGAQRETPAEREAEKNPSEQQDLEKAPEGRDEPPADAVERGKRDPTSPWLGGG